MLNRRAFLCGALCTGVSAPIAAHAQQAGKAYRIGVMSPRVVPPFMGQFGSAMRTHGWVEGRDFTVEERYSGLSVERAQASARNLIDLNVDLILTFTTAQAQAAQQASRTVPIIMITSGFPVEAGLAASLARPGGNVTGLSVYAGGGLFAKYLELLKELIPSLKRFGVFWNYVPPGFLKEEAAVGLGEIKQAAVAAGVIARVFEIDSRAALNHALNVARDARVEAVFVTSGGPFITEDISAEIMAFTLQHRIATITDFASGAFFNAGCLMAYSASLTEMVRRGAAFADRILRGALPGDLPIELPTKFDLIINFKTARALGLTIPPSLLLRADQTLRGATVLIEDLSPGGLVGDTVPRLRGLGVLPWRALGHGVSCRAACSVTPVLRHRRPFRRAIAAWHTGRAPVMLWPPRRPVVNHAAATTVSRCCACSA